VRAYKKILLFVEEVIPALLFVGLVISVLLGVITRYVFNAPLLWASQLATFCFIWVIFLAASGAWRKNMHIGIDLLARALPIRIQPYHQLILQALVLTFLIISIDLALILTGETTKFLQTLNMPYVWMYSAMPVGMGLMALHTVEEIVRSLRTIFRPTGSSKDVSQTPDRRKFS
jgi:TRAP-type C4-dicarboxylate transport system permease small subunit